MQLKNTQVSILREDEELRTPSESYPISIV